MFRNRFFGVPMPFYNTGDGGGSGAGGTGDGGGQGAGAGTGDAGAGGAGAGGAGGGAGAGGASAGAPLSITDPNTMVQFPGMAKPVKFSEWQAQHVPANTTNQALIKLAQILDQQKGGRRPAGQHGQQPNDGGRTRKPSVVDSLRDRVVVGGEDIASLVEELQNNALGPMGKALGAILQRMKAMEGHVGTFREDRNAQEFTGKIQNAIKALPLPELPQGMTQIPGMDVLNDIFENTYLAYHDDPNDPGAIDREYPEMVKQQFTKLRAFFKELDKAELAAAEVRRRKQMFVRPGAGSSGNGTQSRTPLTNREAAGRLFGRSEGAAAGQ